MYFLGLWHIIQWPEWYNNVCFWKFYYDNIKTFCRGFSTIDNLHVTLYRSGVSEHFEFMYFLGLWHIIQWPEWYNNVCFWNFYYDNTKTFCRGFSTIDNLPVTLYRSGVSGNFDVDEQVGVLNSIQL